MIAGMATSKVLELDPRQRVRHLARLAREIAEAALSVELAAERGDIDCLDESVEALAELHQRMHAAYRTLLVVGIRALR
jgi:hypothetical protein